MNKKNIKKLVIPLLLLIILLVPFGFSYVSFQSKHVDNQGAEEFVRKLQAAMDGRTAFKLSELTPVAWDHVYIFHPYTTKSEMERITGTSWTTSRSYVGYLLDNTFLGAYPLDDDSLNKLVFMDDGKVVLDVTLNRSKADFTAFKEIQGDKELPLTSGEDGANVVVSKP